jgi:hypothetical protein
LFLQKNCRHERNHDGQDQYRTCALLLEQNDEWQLQRRYMQLEGMSAASDNQIARLSAVIS